LNELQELGIVYWEKGKIEGRELKGVHMTEDTIGKKVCLKEFYKTWCQELVCFAS
jgi:hypothetical protein